VLAAGPEGAVPAALASATLRATADYVAGSVLAGGAGVPAVTLANEVLHTMSAFKLGGLTALVLLLGLVGGAGPPARGGPGPAEPNKAPAAGAPLAAKPEAPAAPAGADRFGDPLPPGAIARLGTVRLRQGSPARSLAFTPDGKALAAPDGLFVLRLWQ